MDCFLDFCLACDKQTMDGFYCSQACRLADLEKAGSSTPASPSASTSAEHEGWQSYHPSTFSMPSGFDFTSSTKPSPSEKALSHSTSRTSLSSAVSNISTQASPTMSEQIQHELQGYVSSFDAVREMKRRSLSGNSGY